MHSLSASKIVLLFALGSIPAYCAPSLLFPRGLCGTAAPSESLRAVYQKLASPPSENESAEGYESRKIEAPIEIDTWFHILSTEENADLISDAMINDQLSFLQNAYKDAQISYRLKGVTRQINDVWARNADEIAMKTALRKGTYNTLNVYFHTDLEASASGAAARAMSGAAGTERVLGFCTLPDPSINASSPRADYVKDGCNILGHTMPGGPIPHYNKGGTAIHEVGHWNGLLHVFEGESCSADNDGDYIDDTPQQSTSTVGCPRRKDSCPDLPGKDAIHNYMDYSSDDCYESFTPGQLERMRYMWSTLREGK
ncbi:metalloprotease MEP1 [Aspergillus terreus]|uniref:Metalloprotease MEP1 n=1 Tax=Aspergillus terreus TaxID=33178 RepID=A0A8H3MXG9_ASPTE|nr:metalloprotease MEP1 [Aspergillus terreus]